jgi:circadian clock protein KaiC
MYFKTKGLSSISIWEAPQTAGQTFSVAEAGMSFLVDCIVLLRFVEIESFLRKALTILKMRGSDHDKTLREFKITSQGIKLAAPFSGYEAITSGVPRKTMTEEAARAWAKAFAGKPR